MADITLSKGGTAERTVPLSSISIPDVWNISFTLPEGQGELVRELWHLCHDLKRHIEDNDNA